ncbi:FadR/GntR family transcriptional regulator [Aeromicrobium duanguangcaii]|uniref:FCD domain-containing protein n=1 Tax=Aeromicrobium duanguangcaii TaxID=2968086 RepID=A0ABY5KD71_9ACTN|nr:FCD domain-containing protein [Aeromicrobium duanguangcaii]MCD9155075.1 FCD domain-containing protein [Aeromicrobium duanguangcaii]UUI68270.1 FCD domain-containing protein [Aeromicrobium duanguangcaii]
MSDAREVEDVAVTPRTSGAGLPVQKVLPAYQQVANQLRTLILQGDLAPGDRLPNEAELSVRFGVSRSTVREALRVLASRDLVETSRGVNGGTFVARIQASKVRDYLETSLGLMTGAHDVSAREMLEAREVLEVPAARLAAAHARDSDIEALRRSVEREKGSTGRERKFEEHRTFHLLVVDAARNQLLSVMNEPVFVVLRARFLRPDIEPEFWAKVDDDHEEILERIAAGDAAGAGTAMREHLRRLRPAYEGTTEEMP